jgi:hypothetical protein
MSLRARYLSTTLMLVAVGIGYALSQGWGERPAPRLEPGPSAIVRPMPSPPPPSARELLERGAALSLTEGQAARLRDLDQQWSRESAELEQAVQAAGDDFARFMRDAQAARRMSIQEIQQRTAEFSGLSASLRERRRLHGEAAAAVLARAQRQRLGAGTSFLTNGDGR